MNMNDPNSHSQQSGAIPASGNKFFRQDDQQAKEEQAHHDKGIFSSSLEENRWEEPEDKIATREDFRAMEREALQDKIREIWQGSADAILSVEDLEQQERMIRSLTEGDGAVITMANFFTESLPDFGDAQPKLFALSLKDKRPGAVLSSLRLKIEGLDRQPTWQDVALIYDQAVLPVLRDWEDQFKTDMDEQIQFALFPLIHMNDLEIPFPQEISFLLLVRSVARLVNDRVAREDAITILMACYRILGTQSSMLALVTGILIFDEVTETLTRSPGSEAQDQKIFSSMQDRLHMLFYRHLDSKKEGTLKAMAGMQDMRLWADFHRHQEYDLDLVSGARQLAADMLGYQDKSRVSPDMARRIAACRTLPNYFTSTEAPARAFLAGRYLDLVSKLMVQNRTRALAIEYFNTALRLAEYSWANRYESEIQIIRAAMNLAGCLSAGSFRGKMEHFLGNSGVDCIVNFFGAITDSNVIGLSIESAAKIAAPFLPLQEHGFYAKDLMKIKASLAQLYGDNWHEHEAFTRSGFGDESMKAMLAEAGRILYSILKNATGGDMNWWQLDQDNVEMALSQASHSRVMTILITLLTEGDEISLIRGFLIRQFEDRNLELPLQRASQRWKKAFDQFREIGLYSTDQLNEMVFRVNKADLSRLSEVFAQYPDRDAIAGY